MKSLNNKYMHLTNYSINKKNVEYKSNADETACQGHKWWVSGDMKEKYVTGILLFEASEQQLLLHLNSSEWSFCW